MTLTELISFFYAARHHRIKIAARRLKVAHHAVSGRILRLKSEFGITLFDRSTHPYALTADGRWGRELLKNFGLETWV